MAGCSSGSCCRGSTFAPAARPREPSPRWPFLAILWWPIAKRRCHRGRLPRAGRLGAETRLAILGATDTGLFAHLVRGFQARRPDVRHLRGGRDARHLRGLRLRVPPAARRDGELGLDLQVKLVNDGFAQPLTLASRASLPAGPMALGTLRLLVRAGGDRLQSRHPRRERGAAQPSGACPSFWSDRRCGSPAGSRPTTLRARASATCWRRRTSRCRPTSGGLASAFGRAGVRLSGASPAILDGVERGDLALGYNVLGSYAFARQAAGAPHRHRGARRLRPRRHPLDVRAGRGAACRSRRGVHRVRAVGRRPVDPRRSRRARRRGSGNARKLDGRAHRRRAARRRAAGAARPLSPRRARPPAPCPFLDTWMEIVCTAIRQAGFVTGF